MRNLIHYIFLCILATLLVLCTIEFGKTEPNSGARDFIIFTMICASISLLILIPKPRKRKQGWHSYKIDTKKPNDVQKLREDVARRAREYQWEDEYI